MHNKESKFIPKYIPASHSHAASYSVQREQEHINRALLQKARYESNNIVTKNVIAKFKQAITQENHSPIKLTIQERNLVPGQPDLQITLSNFQVNEYDIVFSRSDNSTKSLSHHAFCLQTGLVVREKNEFIKENTDLIYT
jgi:hypothetical protein